MARRKGRSKKQPRRDPNAPKKVTSAWYSFVKDHREAFEVSSVQRSLSSTPVLPLVEVQSQSQLSTDAGQTGRSLEAKR